MTVLLIVLLPFLGALLPVFAVRTGRTPSALAAGFISGMALLLLLSLGPQVFAGEVITASWPWVARIGLNFAFFVDGFGFLFAFLILAIGLLIILYARYYLSPKDPMGRFYMFLLLFQGSMLGVVLSDNILVLLVFWELTSLSSFLLIGYWKHRADARQGARMALAITGGGGLAMLAGFLLLGHIVGSYELTVILRSADIIQAHPLYLPTLILILLGAFTKSAQFPFHFWLPHAMAAPTPVSAYLHSATMVKAGVFLLGRMHPALAGTPEWFFIVTTVGLVTMLMAAYIALFKDDLKGLLAYSTVSHLGLITMLFGIGTGTAAVAAVFHIINHATFKASLFMGAGIIDHETGTRDMRQLGGLWSAMPITGALSIVAAASMAGVPLFNGFLSKEMMLMEVVAVGQYGPGAWLIPLGATLAAIFSVGYSVRFVLDVFFGSKATNLPKAPHEPPRWMRVPVEILVVLCIVVGIVPALIVGPLLAVSAGAVVGGPLPYYSLTIWHGFNLALFLSILALVVGALLYWRRPTLVRANARLPQVTAKGAFDRLIAMLVAGSRGFSDRLHNGSLQRYLAFLIGATVLVMAVSFITGPFGGGSLARTPVDGISLAVWLVMVVALAATVIFHRQRFVALVAVGLVGLIVALAFINFSAPDLAMTQLSVELITIVLLLLALNLLPRTTPQETSKSRVARDIALAAGGGVSLMLAAWAVMTRPFDSISWFHLEQSYPGGGGTNAVNVILVDFRGYDTWGEIIVLAIAGLGIYALIDGLLRGSPGLERLKAMRPPTAVAADVHPLMLSTMTRLLLPLALVVSIYIFLRGHNLPGGGFIAGLVTAVALIMQYMSSGLTWTQDRLKVDYHPVVAWGVIIAGLTGLAAFFFGVPFLTGTFRYLTWPVVGTFEVASALAFDLGVYLTVVGAALITIANLGKLGMGESAAEASRQQIAQHRAALAGDASETHDPHDPPPAATAAAASSSPAPREA